jgi:adenylate cyclase
VDDARALLALCVGGLIDKRRHLVEHAGLTWEVDEFLGDNAGLVVAEVELDSADQTIDLPDWVGAEVTDDARYYNVALASHPYSEW